MNLGSAGGTVLIDSVFLFYIIILVNLQYIKEGVQGQGYLHR